MTERIAATFGTVAVMFTLAACGAAQWIGKLTYWTPTPAGGTKSDHHDPR